MKAKTLRIRMMLLFTTVVGVLLAGSYLAFWGLLAHEVPTQLNRQLLETARPLIADIVTEPNAKDVNRLDIPGEFFELLDSTGRVLQRSRNVTAAIDLNGISPAVSRPTFGIATIGHAQSVRIALVPFQHGNQTSILVVAIPTLRTPHAARPEETEIIVFKFRSAEKDRKTVSAFTDECKKLPRIVEGLFALSMSDAGQLNLMSQPLYTTEVLAEACDLLTSRALV